MRGVELLSVALLVSFLMAERLGMRLDFGAQELSARLLSLQALHLLLQGGLILLCWLPAARSAAPQPRRSLQLGLALMLGTLAAVLLLPAVWALPRCGACGHVLSGSRPWPEVLSEGLILLLVAGLATAVAELRARQRRNEVQLQQVLDEQDRLIREAADARWSAQASRMDPQQLLSALEAIEGWAASADGGPRAVIELEHLMAALRQSLSNPAPHPA